MEKHKAHVCTAQGHIRSSGLCEEDIGELCQILRVKVIERQDQISVKGNPAGYIWRMATNLVKDRHRRAIARPELSLDAPGMSEMLPDERLEGDTCAAAMARCQWEALQSEIGKLPHKLRVAFILVKVNGFTQEEAASGLSVPVDTVNSRVNRAWNRLRKNKGLVDLFSSVE